MTSPLYFSAMERASASMRRGAYAAALNAYQDALTEEPNSAHAHAALSFCLTRLNRRYGALLEAERALAINPLLPVAHVAHGFAALAMNDARSARETVARVKAMEPESTEALYLECIIALHEREAAHLQDAASKLMALAPEDPDAKAMLSRAASMAGRGGEAELLAREALAANPESPANHEAIGWAFYAQGKHRDARDAALSALALAPDDQPSLVLLAAAKLRQRPLTGWIFWGAYWALHQPERRLLTALMIVYGTSLLANNVLSHYGMVDARNVLEAVTWGLCLTWVGTILVLNYMLASDTRQVRVKRNY